MMPASRLARLILAVAAFAAAGADSLPERPLSCPPTFALLGPFRHLLTSGLSINDKGLVSQCSHSWCVSQIQNGTVVPVEVTRAWKLGRRILSRGIANCKRHLKSLGCRATSQRVLARYVPTT